MKEHFKQQKPWPSSIYENQSRTPQNWANKEKVKTANIAEVSMTLGNQEKLHPTNYLKDYVTEWKNKKSDLAICTH